MIKKIVTLSDRLRSIRGGPILLTERRVAELLGYSSHLSLANRRKSGKLALDGLDFVRLPNGHVRYQRDAILHFMKERRV